jgi:hypothetical protein
MAGHKVAGVMIPDSKMAQELTEFIRDTAGEMLFAHSMRVYFWGALAGKREERVFDPELLFVAAMFHDLGLTEAYRKSHLRFEVDGANAAREFLRSHRIDESEVEKVWLAIALHTTPGIPEHLSGEIALIHAGAAMDVVGRGYELFETSELDAVVAAYPRGNDFQHDVIDAFYQGLKHRPETTYGTFNDDYLAFKDPSFQRVDVCSIILSSKWRS